MPRSSSHAKPSAAAARNRRDPPAAAAAALDDARRAGLLEGGRDGHLSFRAPKALIEAAMRESGATGPTELGLLALAMLAQPDPTAEFLRATRGALGPDYDLDG